MSSDAELVDECNKLARRFYAMKGCVVRDDFKFYDAHHPAEVGCWVMAVEAYAHIDRTDMDDVLSLVREEARSE